MVDFRRFALASAALTLFAGLASAQVGGISGGTSTQTCQTNVTATPQLRAEGYTEQTGDITLICTGGTPLATGASVPLVNFTIYYNTTVTSRLLSNSSTVAASEALLLIDEPGSGLSGFGPTLPQVLCSNPAGGCGAVVGTSTTGSGSTYASVNAGTAVAAPNMYQGVVSGNSVTFFGVPALPPGTTGSRVFRITNVRVNATTFGAAGSQVQASVSISGATALLITNPTLTTGYVYPSLTATVSGANTTLAQCANQSKTSVGLVNFAETANFGSAFKTRVVPFGSSNYSGQSNGPGYTDLTNGSVVTPNQNTPTQIVFSESNFIYPVGSQVAGLADYGTRLKATFNNIPTGVNVYVSTFNVSNNATEVAAPSVPGGTSTASYAQLINGDTVSDFNSGSSFFPAITATDNAGTVRIAPVTIAANTGSAVWEVLNTNPNATETISFGVYITYTANVTTSTPAIGTSTVNLSYAPNATSGAASSSLGIPRFQADATAARTLFTINLCRTILLYPYITNQAGFDTGLTVANTSQDPYTLGTKVTAAQAGSCTFTWYGGTTAAPTTPPAATNTGTIGAGTVWAGLASTLVPSFQGYAFAVCNFQWAHGFAFISDLGARNLAMGYLAVVLNDPGTGSRSNTNTTTAENGGH
jgi:hypothetical protein